MIYRFGGQLKCMSYICKSMFSIYGEEELRMYAQTGHPEMRTPR